MKLPEIFMTTGAEDDARRIAGNAATGRDHKLRPWPGGDKKRRPVAPLRSSGDAAVIHPRVLSEKALAARAVAFSARNTRHFRP